MFYLKQNASNCGGGEGPGSFSSIYITPVLASDKLTPVYGTLDLVSTRFSKYFGDVYEVTGEIRDLGAVPEMSPSVYRLRIYHTTSDGVTYWPAIYDTPGPVAIDLTITSCLQYRDIGYVLPANIYDAWFGSSNQEVDVSSTSATELAAALLKLDFSTLSGEAQQSLLNAARKLVNKVAIAGNTLSVYKEDGVTPAFIQTVGTNSSQQPIVSLNTV